MYQSIGLDLTGPVAALTLRRPQVLNAISPPMAFEMRDAVAKIRKTGSVRCVLLAGEGKAFCSGADLGADTDADIPADEMLERVYNPLIADLFGIQVPVVAAVNGLAVGAGVGLALTADIVVCARKAWFLHGFDRIGLTSDCGVSWAMMRRCGLARANEFSLLGERVPSQTAQDWGMVNAVVDDGELANTASALAASLASGATRALMGIKRLQQASLGNDLAAQLALEAGVQREVAKSRDFLEGVAAFRDKRPPVFGGY